MYSSFNIPLNFKGACTKREHDGSALYNSYYQWVSLYLVISALMFYAPRYQSIFLTFTYFPTSDQNLAFVKQCAQLEKCNKLLPKQKTIKNFVANAKWLRITANENSPYIVKIFLSNGKKDQTLELLIRSLYSVLYRKYRSINWYEILFDPCFRDIPE